MCPLLPYPDNGFITYTEQGISLGFMETATYACNPGYGLSGGDTVRTCVGAAGSSGEWSGVAPTCERKNLRIWVVFIGVQISYMYLI